jgi:CTP:molybdopterin cytidylyltransferase MocA
VSVTARGTGESSNAPAATPDDRPLAIVVLAGDRGPQDPIAAAAGVVGKVLAPIAGRPMLAHVLSAARALGDGVPIRVVCNERPEYREVVDSFAGASGAITIVEPASGPAASLVRALETLPSDSAVLVLTGDHPLVLPEWLQGFLERAAETRADAVVGLADIDQVQARFPEGRRTRYRFSDRRVGGTNLFLFRTERGRRVVDAWLAFERDRKRPWRIVARLGLPLLFRYLLGRLTVDGAFAALSKSLGAEVRGVILPWPEAAVDVDSVDDRDLVERIFELRVS